MAEAALRTVAPTGHEPEPEALTGAESAPEALFDDEFIAAGGHPTHVHAFHQFLYVPLGRIVVTALGRDHELSPSVALWIPAGIPHSARFDPDSLVVPETFEPDLHRLPYSEVTSVNVSDAQRQLLLSRMRASEVSEEDPAVFAVLCAGHRDVLPLPQPTGRSAATVAGELMRNPGDPRTASEWAESLYTSSTSLRRAFRAETGLAFSEWRTRLRLNHSLQLLAAGHMVSTVAARVGFVSTNGYILAFRRYFGETPGAYVKRSATRTAA
ncbi:helix-turn-helix transcriptional regulator [Streptomyces cyaneofuscatus]|uniref:helix-turn-helix transcriptional regulator n=1 Tax=Streptomyces cyaneofuscatus TaxID=66883 RepID=UPI0036918D0E